MDITNYIQALCIKSQKASAEVAIACSQDKNYCISNIAETIASQTSNILAENNKDLDQAKNNNLDSAMIDRLTLSKTTVGAMIEGLYQIAKLPDPIGSIGKLKSRPSGIKIGQMRVPIGVIGIIYESRPNVTADAAGLCLKSGNAVILRGGSESFFSNQAIGKCISTGLKKSGFPDGAIQLISTTNRDAVGELLKSKDHVDLIIPRGGKGLIKRVSSESQVPVLKHLDGICHVYIDKSADEVKAIDIADNSKTQRFGTCNTMETLLIHKSCAQTIVPKIYEILQKKQVEVRLDERARKIVPTAKAATQKDWSTEYLAPILSVGIVDSAREAISHINTFGSGHTDAIVSSDESVTKKFLREVDSSSVMVNASTRFADGFEYGLGAEIGISTDKLHARGPVGLEGLTSLKWIVYGDGHVRK